MNGGADAVRDDQFADRCGQFSLIRHKAGIHHASDAVSIWIDEWNLP
jgi:hypothetical protein